MAKLTRARFLQYAIVVAATVVVVLLVLIAFGAIRLPSSAAGPPSVTVTGVHWVIEQGTTSSGLGWFGPNEFNYTSADGYPVKVNTGDSLTIPWTFSNFDSSNHSIYEVYVGPPFSLVSTTPTIPLHGGVNVPAGTDDAFLNVVVRAPSQTAAPLILNLTVDALFPTG